MKPIISPIKPSDIGPQVTNLQDALFLLIDRQVIKAQDAPNKPTLEELQKLTQGLKDERAQSLFGDATNALVRYFQIQQGLGDNLHGFVEDKTAAKMNEILKSLGAFDENTFIVRGTVRDSNGKPSANVIVRAFDRDLRNKPQLGKDVVTDAKGYYEIRYTAEQFAAADSTPNAAPDLIVRVYNADGQALAESPTRFNAGREETIDLVIAAPALSEWVIISQTVIPLLIGQGPDGKPLPPWELNDDDISFIVKETGLDREQVRLWVLAVKMSREVELISPISTLPDFTRAHGHHAASAALDDALEFIAFYGWFRDGQPQQFNDLIRRPIDELMNSFERGIAQMYIPAVDSQLKDKLRKSLDVRRIDEALRPAKEGEPASLGDLFDTLGGDWLKKEVRQKTAGLLQDVGAESDEFMPRLKEIIPEENKRQDLRRTLRLGDLTMKHAPMVKALQPFAAESGDDTIRGLSKIETDRWLDMAYEHGVPPSSFITPEQYAQDVEQTLEAKAPTAVLAAKLENKTIVIEQPGFSGVQAVLKKHPGLDIASDDIDEFVKNNNIEPATATALGKLQHLKRLDARWDEAAVLVNTGLDSVAQITEYGSEQFKSLLSEQISEGRIEKIHEQATALQAVSIGLMGYLQPMLFGVSAEVMGMHKNLTASKGKIDSNPTLRKLFGALENCACDPCMSVLSPAAYLADLLKFLDPSHEASNLLRARRPDIYDLELSCENTNIELPQIDLAIEILENAVAFPYNVPLPVGTNIQAELSENQPVGALVRKALQKTAVDRLGQHLSAQPDHWTSRYLILIFGVSYWVVTDRYRRWVLKASKEYFGYKGKGGLPPYAGMDLAGIDVQSLLAAMNRGQVPAAVEQQFKHMLVNSVHAKVPVSVTYYEIARLEEDRQWNVSFTVEGIASVLPREKKLTLVAADGGGQKTRLYSQQTLDATEQALKQGQFGGIVGGLDRIFGKYVTVVPSQGQWKYRKSLTIKILYQPAGLTIVGLSYQSTAADRDLFTRPQNRNPLAYKRLSGDDARFPWSLPYDYNLAETREALRAAGVSRLELMETSSNSKTHYSSVAIARERLGLSLEEWKLITDQTRVTSNKVWGDWGLGITSASQKTKLIDTFIDKELEATPFGKDGLLTRVSIVLQQARLKFSELQEMLQTDFINPGGAVKVALDTACQPSEMTLNGVDAGFLDRLHRFVRLWRATGWEIWEIDLALQSFAIGNKALNENALVEIANLGVLKERLDLSIETLVAMIGGFSNKRYSHIVKGELQELTPLYDRLFQNRQLVDPPVEGLAFSATLSALTDQLEELIAASVGIRRLDLAALLNSNDLDSPRPVLNNTPPDKKNKLLQWIFRNVTLAQSMRLPFTDYETACRLFPSDYFTTPATLLEFLDEIDFVKNSGFIWGELDYILLGSTSNSSEDGLTVQRAAEVLTSLQRELKQLEVPEPAKAVVPFSLTSNDLKTPPLPETPRDDQERFNKHWGLTEDGQQWVVKNPKGSGKLNGTGLELLARIDVLAQQARLPLAEIMDALKTTFVAGEDPLKLTTGKPVSVKNMTTDHLDRLEVFIYLLRTSRLTAQDLGLLLQAFAATNDPMQWDLSKLIEPSQKVLTLQERLQLPLGAIIGWWINPPGDDQIKSLAELVGVGVVDFKRLLTAFKTEAGKDPLASPSTLLEFVDGSLLLKQRIELVTQNLAQAVSLEPSFVNSMLWDYLHTSDTSPKSAIQYLISEKFKNSTDTINETLLVKSDEYAILARLHKIALLNAKWKANLAELAWLNAQGLTQSECFIGLIFDSLPPAKAQTPPPTPEAIKTQLQALVTNWKRSTTLYKTAHSSPAMAQLVSAYLEAFQTASNDKLKAAGASLEDSFNLSEVTVKACVDKLGIAASNQYLDPLRFDELLELLSIVQRLGIDHTNLDSLVAEAHNLVAAELGRKLLRTRFGESGWKKALRQVTDALRIQQRDRLVDYLLAKEGLRDVNSLYEHFLIDVEMSPCMNTTRLLQSTAAVQLFVQRCLFNLEKQVPPKSIDREHWEKMQNRGWEANRKVFLYPENWLFPEVRDDQTGAFRDFVQKLTLVELNNDTAHEEAINYLSTVKTHSSLSVRGLFEYSKSQSTHLSRRLIVIGNQASRNSYFWRECIDWKSPSARWTGWQPIEGGNIGDYVIPFAIDGIPHVIWPTMAQIKGDTDSDAGKWEVSFQWFPLDKKPVKPKKLFGSLTAPVVPNKDLRTSFAFRACITKELIAVASSPVSNIGERSRVDISCYCIPPSTVVNTGKFTSSVVGWTEFRFSSLPSVANAEAWIEVKVRLFTNYKDGTLPRSAFPTTLRLERVIDDDLNRENLISSVVATAITNADGVCVMKLNLTEAIPYWPSRSYRLFLRVSTNNSAEDQTIILRSAEFQQLNERLSDEQRPAVFTLTYICTIANESQSNQPIQSVPLLARRIMERFGMVHIDEQSLESSLHQDSPLQQVPGMISGSGGYLSWGIMRDEDASHHAASFSRIRPWKLWRFQSIKGVIAEVVSGGSDRASLPLDSDSEAWHFADGVSSHFIGVEDSRWTIINNSRPITSISFDQSSADWIKVQSTTDIIASGVHAGVHGKLFIDYQPRPMRDIAEHSLTSQGVHFAYLAPDAVYNWEIFYHLPIAIATSLSRQHRFEDARRWFHFVFDPTTNDPSTGRERFWRFLPFRTAQVPDTITQLLETLANPAAPSNQKEDVKQQIAAWLEDPFNPFAVARLRTSAFEWYTVIAYIKNLIAWADQLFRRDTRESINEATLLYVMAAQILGPRPERIRARGATRQPLSYRALQGKWDDFSNAWLTLSNSSLVQAWTTQGAQHRFNPQSSWSQIEQLSSIGSLYFCVLPNEKLPELWDMVDDRLFKIRHCQNIEGVTRSLPLFEPPIDPELLIRAKSAGLDLADVLADRYAPLPHYRFQVLLQKANEFCNEVKSLGAAILSAVEKKEAEHLSLLRSRQEIDMLKLIEAVKAEQVKEAQANLESLQKTRSNAVDRFTFLQRQLGKSEITFDVTGAPIVEQALMAQVQETGAPDDFRSLSLIQPEIDQVWRMQDGHWATMVAGGSKIAAGVLKTAAAGAKADITGTAKEVFSFLGEAASFVGDASSIIATNASFWERRSGLIGGWLRRRDEWVQQSRMTAEEVRQIDKQILALEIRKTITEKELGNHRTQIENARNIDDYMRHLKFSSESLYGWMEGQLAGLYFATYQLAYDLAKKAERAYQFELGDPSSTFVQFGHWDNLRKGLLSGERLSQNLRRMEAAYLERNRRELEITKHVSLRQLDPLALIQLRETGECDFTVPEVLFDLDFPGHYFRRIKSASISIPCVVGPYSSVSGTLTLLSSKLRDKSLVSGNYSDEAKYKASYLPIQSIATSTGQNDSGLFELNFRDERYLPFEGTGAISRWRFKLPNDFRPFDYDTISDVVLHFRYTARDGGEPLALAANTNTSTSLNKLKAYGETDEGLWLLIDLRHDFPAEWHRYNKSTTNQAVTIKLESDRFPLILRGRTINLTGIQRSSLPSSSIGPISIAPGGVATIVFTEDDFKGEDSWIALRYTV